MIQLSTIACEEDVQNKEWIQEMGESRDTSMGKSRYGEEESNTW